MKIWPDMQTFLSGCATLQDDYMHGKGIREKQTQNENALVQVHNNVNNIYR